MKGNRVLLWLLCCGTVSTLPIGEFYPHGPAIDNSLPKSEDSSSPEIFLRTPIRFFGELHNSLFVNDNGILSFLTDIPSFLNIQFPLDYPVIAPLYTNVDNRKAGDIFYRETESPDLLAQISYKIGRLYPNLAVPFTAKSLFIVTWLNVGYYKEGSDKLNTYQVAIATDGDESFVELLYKDNGIQWLQGTGLGSGLPDARAQVGFVSADGRMYSIKGSGTDQIKNLDKWTNAEIPGLFIFRIGHIGPTGNVEPPQTTVDLELAEQKSCVSSSTTCHSQAQCIDNENGFCCVCREGYYGNGRTCLKDGIPLRVNGKVLFNLNSINFPNVDLQAYIVTSDSRSYTAFSRVPGELGASLQLLILFPGVIGWLFAKPVSGAKNGYQLTGGVFNHTMEIKFHSSNHYVKINQRFNGLDVFDQLRLEAEIHGNIPVLPNVNLSMPDYTQQFTRIAPGTLRSQSTHSVKLENGGQEYKMTVDQSVYYHEHCPLESFALKLKTGRNFINYEATEKILRFASTTKVSKISENEDPCLEGQVTCVANSSCLAEGDSFKCVCNPGFQTVYASSGSEEYGCVDINECLDGTSTCHQNAICINQVGSFSCQCRPGFTGNGYVCSEIESPCQRNPDLCNQPNSYCLIPGDLTSCLCHYGFQKVPLDEGFTCVDVDECQTQPVCHSDADCENTEGSFKCACKPGFYGDGIDCQWTEQHTCEIISCGKGAECIDDPYEGAKCVCQKGFTGDGNNCKPEKVKGCHSCAREAVCQDNTCVCKHGFIGDGLYCTPSSSQTTLKTCLDGACWCPPGYYSQDNPPLCIKGDKDFVSTTEATPTDDVPCNVINKCHYNARCIIPSNQPGAYQCKCNPGYEGDGYDCSLMEISCFELDVCDPHATCKPDRHKDIGICECNDGFQGDGMFCSKVIEQEISCFELDVCDPHATCIPDRHKNIGICECNEGFQGDGMFCNKMMGCSSDDDCGLYTACSFNADKQMNECVCLPGYNKLDDGTCSNECECHSEADCIYDGSFGHSMCVCRTGFEGDGITKCDPISTPSGPPGCNEVNNCSPSADCVYNHSISTYHCQCRPGSEGDGLVCHPVENCYTNPHLCHSNAECAQTSYTDYHCKCKPGFVGNGQKCRAEYTGVDEFLLVNQGMATLRIPYQPSRTDPGYPIQLKTEQVAIGLSIDCVEARVYWSDIMSRAIVSSAYNGADKEEFITTEIGSPEGLAIDWVNRNLYWTDSSEDTVNVANLDTKERKVIVSQGLVNPRGIAVHPHKRKIFWSDWNRVSPKLEVSQFDGSNRAVFVQGPAVQLPNSLAIDWDTDELCWADAGTKSIECIGITTLDRRTVVTNCTYPFGLAISSDKYYWTDWNTQKIESAWKATSTRADPIDVPLGGAGKLYGITTVPQSCPHA